MSMMSSASLRPAGGAVGLQRLTPAVGLAAALALTVGATLVAALEAPSKPFLEKNSFYLSSAGFRIQLANDADGRKALRALPPHRFVIHTLAGGDVRYLYAEPQHCVCVFVGTRAAYDSYRAMLSAGPTQVDDAAPDYKTQAGALLATDPVALDTIGADETVLDYLRLGD